jgi:hypothetical protein
MPGSVSWAPVTATLASTSTAGVQPRRPAQALTGQRIMIRDGKAVIVEPKKRLARSDDMIGGCPGSMAA